MEDIFNQLLSAPPTSEALTDIDAWWTRHRERTGALERPIHRAIIGGFVADRPAYAFAAGYQEALRRLFPDLDGSRKCAMCATEEGGAHPRAIRTSLTESDPGDGADGAGWQMSGRKEWTTLGPHADEYIVFASVGEDDDGKNRLAAVRIPKGREGVSIETRPGMNLIPEVPHARLKFTNVAVAPEERLDGDGYIRYLKPFRTIEDCHVYAALTAWVLQVARRSEWPREAIEQMILLLASVTSIADADPLSPVVHVALAGLIARSNQLFERLDALWPDVDSVTHERWLRDRKLLLIASKARNRRREVAWERLVKSAAE